MLLLLFILQTLLFLLKNKNIELDLKHKIYNYVKKQGKQSNRKKMDHVKTIIIIIEKLVLKSKVKNHKKFDKKSK